MEPRLRFDIGWADLAYALLCRGRSRVDAAPPQAVAALSVRTLWDALLTELDLPAGSVVLMSGINIEGMAAIVRAHGLVPEPLDLDEATLAPDPAALAGAGGDRARVFLLAHLYGARLPTSEYARVCRSRGLLFVEDRAQAYDGRLYRGEGADVALYSFGPIKTATALGGAVGLFAHHDLQTRVEARLRGLPPVSNTWFRRRVLKYMALKLASAPPLYGALWRALERSGRDPDALIGGIARGFGPNWLQGIRRRAPPALLALLQRRLERNAGLGRRPAVAADIAARLAPALPSPGASAAEHGWWLIPVLSRQPQPLIDRLRQAGFDATRGATSLRAVEGEDGRPPRGCARLLEQIVYLPAPRRRRARDRLVAAALGAAGGAGLPRSGLEQEQFA